MRPILNRSLLTILISLAGFISRANDPAADSLISRYRVFLLQSPDDPEKVPGWLNTLENGQWPDIDYQDQERANWKTREHLSRIVAMAIAWARPGSPYYGRQALLQACTQALDHWLDRRYKNSNWWHNEIGIPQLMRDIMVLLKGQLNGRQWAGSLAVLGQLRVRGTGANLTWSADLGLHYAAFTDNAALTDSCRTLLINEIVISTREGVQPDLSFHQHGARLQNYHYGKAFLTDNVRLAWQCRNTDWAFPEEKVRILMKLLLEGDQWMSRGRFISPAAIDRAISRPGFLLTGDLSQTARLLKDLLPEMSKPLDLMIAGYKGRHPDLGYKAFPYSDFASYSDHNYSFFLKTISTRTLAAETATNSENLKGQLLNGGNTFFVKTGQEYADLMPVWDWNKLPGITGFSGHPQLEPQAFNGGLGHAASGCWAMDYAISDKSKKLTARKFWAVHENVMVCLIAGIRIEGNPDSVFTVLDQCRLQTKVEQNKAGNFLPGSSASYRLPATRWIRHGGFAYFPLSDNPLLLTAGKASGSWHAINQSAGDQKVEDSIFMPVLLHPKKESAGNAAYAVAACATAGAAQDLASHPSWTIISNTVDCQAVGFGSNILMISFAAKGTLRTDKHVWSVDRPCMLLLDREKLYLSDPLHQGGSIVLKIDKTEKIVTLPQNGEAIQIIL